MSDALIKPVPAVDPRLMMRYDANKKSAGLAYALWFFFGLLGGHRFYLGRAGSGAAMAILFVVSLVLSVVLIGYLGLFVLAVWALIDAFLIPGFVSEHNNRLIRELGG